MSMHRCDYVELLYGLRDAVPGLRSLVIARSFYQGTSIWVGYLEGLDNALPRLQRLFIHGFAEFSPLDMPNLRYLELRPTDLTNEDLVHIMNSRFPALQEFRVWHGPRSAAYLEGHDMEALLEYLHERTGVRRLGLLNTFRTNTLIHTLIDSPLASRLVELDLSLGTLRNAGIVTLMDRLEKKFPNLRRLDVSGNLLTMKPGAPNGVQVIYGAQREPTLDAEPAHPYST